MLIYIISTFSIISSFYYFGTKKQDVSLEYILFVSFHKLEEKLSYYL